MAQERTVGVLMIRAGRWRCALPIESVVETMRPLPQQPVEAAPPYVSGAAVIRGQAVPVVDLAALLGTEAAVPSRFVVIRAGRRRVAVAVEAVMGVRHIPAESLAGVPPLLSDAGGTAVASLGVLDSELLVALEAARIVSEEVWSRLDESGRR